MKVIGPLKLIVAGDGGTGKSTLLDSKFNGSFSHSSKITIGVDFRIMNIIDPSEVQFLIFDLGGQKRFQFLHTAYIIGAKGAILLYDLSRPKTFEHLEQWLDLLVLENPNIPIILGGTKKDIVMREDLDFFTEEWKTKEANIRGGANVIGHYFISSKTLENVDRLFKAITGRMKAQLSELSGPPIPAI